MNGTSSSTVGQLLWQRPMCISWKPDMEGAVYHLASCILLLGFMGGSGVYGCFYLFGFLGTGYLCCALWGWLHACGLDVVLWSFLLAMACVLQLAYLVYRLREDTLPEEFNLLYKTLWVPLQVPLQTYKEIVHCCDEQVLTLATEQTYAVEGETPINRLSLLLSGRSRVQRGNSDQSKSLLLRGVLICWTPVTVIRQVSHVWLIYHELMVRVSQDGQFLHYIFPYQFLDSPEWESLQPSEEGVFQVTLTAETECSYISWPRKSLHLLLTKERYISRLFSALLGYDISEKLYTLNDKLFAKFALRFDIRLPSLYHVLGPAAPDTEPESEKDDEEARVPAVSPPQATATSAQHTPTWAPPPAATNFPAPLSRARMSRPHSGILGEDSTSLVLEDFEEVSGSESLMDYRSDGEYMR